MKWYHYIAVFFAGVFLCNAVPHLVQGLCGQMFPTPFANPPGEGLSSSTVNVLWGLFNLLAGYVLLRVSKLTNQRRLGLGVLFGGIACTGVLLSITFQ